jgi:Ca-activated chloride channel family protein
MTTFTMSAVGVSLLTVALAAAQTPASAVDAQLVSPIDGSYASGPTPLVAHVEPASAVSTVVFSVDGRQVCSLTTPPFVCDWNAGSAVDEHQIRLVVNLAAGGRVVRTVSTQALGYVDAVSVEAVQLTAVVTKDNRFVRGLTNDAFRVFEDDKLQSIVHFSSQEVPLELVLAIDMSTSVTPAMDSIKTALKEFLGAIAPTDHVTLLAFNSNIYTLSRRETNPAERIKAVDALAPNGPTALYDVIIRGVDLLGQQTGRKALVVFTDGEDQGSNAGLNDVEERLKGSDVTLYMVGEGRGLQVEALKRGMQKLAEPSGGRVFLTDKAEELHTLFTELRSELSNQYVLGYVSTNVKRDGSWRKLRVETPGKGQVRTRDGYRAPNK